ncbi:phosphatidate cytidylyltransferase [Paracoccus albus]|uniref:phosphatidate cytidylyltransferase n=1 Tax=Paracoccus albus TaxID=3017784 RepID=UPI0022F032EC|nr:phosphatidate cytidylyltransferase [Paracoccus albus]WBU59105.1 phosphatidate cytidylyltransferase [Paracoccus albus]
MTKAGTKGSWTDLRVRVISGVVLAVLGLGLLASHGLLLMFGVSVLVGLMMWELTRMTAAIGDNSQAMIIACLSGVVMLVSLLLPGWWAAVLAFAPVILGWPRVQPQHRVPFALFTLGIFGAGYGLFVIRNDYGLLTTFWIAGTVVISDIAGYFAGRYFGGPKFWPSISPKKTWSGTVAGWVGAFLFALILLLVTGGSDWSMLIAGPTIALAGQFGDIGESWLKRRVGVKDSSNMIPGHGGVMDRFDALSGAFLVALILYMLGI